MEVGASMVRIGWHPAITLPSDSPWIANYGSLSKWRRRLNTHFAGRKYTISVVYMSVTCVWRTCLYYLPHTS